jgi:uncharacterized protein DUF397
MTHGPHRWHKSSYSGQGTNCVELAANLEEIRDSKNPAGPALRAKAAALLTAIKAGRLDR